MGLSIVGQQRGIMLRTCPYFEVHENCCDCAGFYDGCRAWPDSRPFDCHSFNRLPDVMPGTCGQRFPATSRKLACGMAKERQTEYADTIPCSSAPDADSRVTASDSGEARAPVVNRASIRVRTVNWERPLRLRLTTIQG